MPSVRIVVSLGVAKYKIGFYMKGLAKCFAIIFIALVTLSGCEDDIEGPNVLQDGKIRGTIIDSTGNPIANASVALILGPSFFNEVGSLPSKTGIAKNMNKSNLLDLSSGNDMLRNPYPNPINGTSRIPFHIEDTTNTKIWITKFCSEDTIEILVDDLLLPGEYEFMLATRDSMGYNYINGGYYVNMMTGDYSEKILVVIHNSEGDAITDGDGSFIFDQECLPFGEKYIKTGEISPERKGTIDITRYIGFFITLPNDEIALYDSIFVDSLKGTDVTLKFSPPNIPL